MAKAKTILLIALVIISCFLANALMSGQPFSAPSGQNDLVWYGPEPGLHEVSLPGRIYIIGAQGEARLVETFSNIYNELVVTLGQIHYDYNLGGAEWSPGEYARTGYPPGVLFRYDYQISREFLASWLSMFYETDFPFVSIDSIFVPMERGPVQFINSTTREVWQLQVSMPWDVFYSAVVDPPDTLGYSWTPMKSGENYAAAPGVYEIADPEIIVIPDWYSEEINYDALLRSFYLEPALIQEPDGTEIYTDGLQALRIYPSGAVEYTVVSSQPSSTMPLQKGLVQTSLRFITAHGGWPGMALPTEVVIRPATLVRLEYVSFGLGLPVISDKAGLAIEMKGLSVSRYDRNLIRVRSDVIKGYAEIHPLSVLLSSMSTQASQYFTTVNQEISDLALVYYWKQGQIMPAWRVWVGRQVIYVGAEDGRILGLREQLGGS